MQATTEIATPPTPLIPIHLTFREAEVLYWIGEGKSDWEIGLILRVKPKTVNYHAERLKLKLTATNRIQMIRQAVRLGLLEA